MREVAIELDAADAILVDEPVAVAVDAFPVHRPAAGLALLRIGALHQARVVGRRRERPARIRHPHHRDHAVTVEVFRRILVDAPVVVVVERREVAAPRRLERGEHRLAAVDVEARHDVEDAGGELTPHGLVGRAEQGAGDPQRQRAAGDLVGAEVRDQQDARPRAGRQRPQARRSPIAHSARPPAVLPDRDQRRGAGMGGRQGAQVGLERGVRRVPLAGWPGRTGWLGRRGRPPRSGRARATARPGAPSAAAATRAAANSAHTADVEGDTSIVVRGYRK